MIVYLTVGALVGLALLQLWALQALGPRAPVGDEGEYLSSTASQPEVRPFLRVPMMHWLGLLLGASVNNQGRFRIAMSVSGIISVVLVMAAAWVAGGWPAALAALVFLALLPERLILNSHLWPDPLIAVWLAAINLILISPMSTDHAAAALGLLVALSTLTRIEQVVLVLAVPWAFSIENSLSLVHLVLICGPSSVLLAGCAVWNYRRHGIPLPDNTWLFNLRVADAEMDSTEGVTRVAPLVLRVVPDWLAKSPQQRSRRGWALWLRLAKRPWRFARTVASRAWSLLGSDSFVSECLLPASGHAYPSMTVQSARRWRIALRVSFPIMIAIVLALVWSTQRPLPAFIIPTLSIYAVAAAFHSRTRFRLALFPGLALLFAYVMPQSVAEIAQLKWALYACLAAGLAALLICFPTRRELP